MVSKISNYFRVNIIHELCAIRPYDCRWLTRRLVICAMCPHQIKWLIRFIKGNYTSRWNWHLNAIYRYISDIVIQISTMPTGTTTRCTRSCLLLTVCLLLLVATLRFGGLFKDLPTLVNSRLNDMTDSEEVRLKNTHLCLACDMICYPIYCCF